MPRITGLTNYGKTGRTIGEIIKLCTPVVPYGFLYCNGTAYSRTTYSSLFNAITFAFTGNVSSGNATILSVSPDPTASGIVAGMPISGTGIAAATTVLSFTSNTIVLSQVASGNGTGAAISVCPYGVGDMSSTFNVPDGRGRVLMGDGTGTGLTARMLGTITGTETHQIGSANLPNHNHGVGTLVNDGGSAHSHGVGAYVNDGGSSHSHTHTTAAGNAHSHTISTAAGNSHSHTFSTNTPNLNHRHSNWVNYPNSANVGGGGFCYAGDNTNTSSQNGATSYVDLSHSHSGTVDAPSAHSHTGTTDAPSAHSHTGTTDAGNTHSHLISGNSAQGNTHSHLISGSTDSGSFANNSINHLQPSLGIKFAIAYV